MAAPTIRGSTAAAAGLSATSPASTQVDDLVIVGTWERTGAGVPTHTLQSGFTELRTHAHDDGSTDGRLSFAYKIATSSGATSYQAYTSSSGTNVWTGIVVLTAGTFNIVAPLFASNSSTLTTNAVPNPPSVTLTTARDFLVLAIGAWHLGSAATVAITAPTNYTETWEMAGSNLGEFSIASRSLTAPASEDPGAFTDDVAPNGSVSMTLAFGNVLAFTRSAAVDGAGGIATAATFFTTFERAIATGATGDIATAATFLSVLERQAAVAAIGDVASVGTFFTTFDRQVAMNADAAIAVSGVVIPGVVTYERAVAAGATAAIEVAPQRELLRSSTVTAAGGVASTGQRDLLRAIASSASAAVATSAMRDVLRAAALGADAAIASSGRRDLLRAIGAGAAGGIATSGQVQGQGVERAVSCDAVGAITTIGEVVHVLLRAATLGADAAIEAIGQRVHVRGAGLAAVAAIVVHVPGEHAHENIGEGWLGPYRARGWLREYRGGVD